MTKTLDISEFNQTGQELVKEIERAVADTQRVLIQELPNELLMTRFQFEDLLDTANMPKMHESKDRLYQTRYNVMEVKVKEVAL